jgi:hypothetical protein
MNEILYLRPNHDGKSRLTELVQKLPRNWRKRSKPGKKFIATLNILWINAVKYGYRSQGQCTLTFFLK